MAGKSRLDMVETQIAAIERRRGGDVIAAFLRTLPDEQFAALRARLEAGEDPVTVLKDFTR